MRGIDPDSAEEASEVIHLQAFEREGLKKRMIILVKDEEILGFLKDLEIGPCFKKG